MRGRAAAAAAAVERGWEREEAGSPCRQEPEGEARLGKRGDLSHGSRRGGGAAGGGSLGSRGGGAGAAAASGAGGGGAGAAGASGAAGAAGAGGAGGAPGGVVPDRAWKFCSPFHITTITGREGRKRGRGSGIRSGTIIRSHTTRYYIVRFSALNLLSLFTRGETPTNGERTKNKSE